MGSPSALTLRGPSLLFLVLVLGFLLHSFLMGGVDARGQPKIAEMSGRHSIVSKQHIISRHRIAQEEQASTDDPGNPAATSEGVSDGESAKEEGGEVPKEEGGEVPKEEDSAGVEKPGRSSGGKPKALKKGDSSVADAADGGPEGESSGATDDGSVATAEKGTEGDGAAEGAAAEAAGKQVNPQLEISGRGDAVAPTDMPTELVDAASTGLLSKKRKAKKSIASDEGGDAGQVVDQPEGADGVVTGDAVGSTEEPKKKSKKPLSTSPAEDEESTGASDESTPQKEDTDISAPGETGTPENETPGKETSEKETPEKETPDSEEGADSVLATTSEKGGLATRKKKRGISSASTNTSSDEGGDAAATTKVSLEEASGAEDNGIPSKDDATDATGQVEEAVKPGYKKKPRMGVVEKEAAPDTVESEKEDSGNSGVAQELALGEGRPALGSNETEPEASGGGGAVVETPLVSVGAPEQMRIEQAALDDDDDYADFMSELVNAGQRISPAMQGLKEKAAKHMVPTMQELARKGHAAFMKTSDKIRTHVTPLLGPSLSPLVSTLLSYSLLILPLILIGVLVYQIRLILTVPRILVLCNLYLCIYSFTLLAACIIISGEPMRSLQQAAEANFLILQILQALGYLIYICLQIWSLSVVTRAKGKDRDVALIAIAAFQVFTAIGIGLHYYVFVFERAMLDKAPKITAWSYLLYSLAFLVLYLIGRPKDSRTELGKQT